VCVCERERDSRECTNGAKIARQDAKGWNVTQHRHFNYEKGKYFVKTTQQDIN